METNVILQGDALKKLKELPDESIDCVMTSPPYWALRDYGSSTETIWQGNKSLKEIGASSVEKCWNDSEHDFQIKERKLHSGSTSEEWAKTVSRGMQKAEWKVKDGFCTKCNAWKGQLGIEQTFDLFIKHLCDIFNEIKRVLKKTGTCWVNIGDSYAGNMGKRNGWTDNKLGFTKEEAIESGVVLLGNTQNYGNVKDKSLCGIPFRFAIEMINRGWILRNTLIWHKPNCMPSSAKDRFTIDFEYLFFFTKNKKYYFETQYESYSKTTMEDRRFNPGSGENFYYNGKTEWDVEELKIKPQRGGFRQGAFEGRNKRCVWSIPPRPFPESHFAVFPEELCETPIKAGCPKFVCDKCGVPKRKIVEVKANSNAFNIRVRDVKEGRLKYFDRVASEEEVEKYVEKSYESLESEEIISEGCECNTTFSGGIVLDPFFGAGTSGLVAWKQNKRFIGIELNPEYIKIAQQRLKPYIEQTKLDKLFSTELKGGDNDGESSRNNQSSSSTEAF